MTLQIDYPVAVLTTPIPTIVGLQKVLTMYFFRSKQDDSPSRLVHPKRAGYQ